MMRDHLLELSGIGDAFVGFPHNRQDRRELVLHAVVDLAHQQPDAALAFLGGGDVAGDRAPTISPEEFLIAKPLTETATSGAVLPLSHRIKARHALA